MSDNNASKTCRWCEEQAGHYLGGWLCLRHWLKTILVMAKQQRLVNTPW